MLTIYNDASFNPQTKQAILGFIISTHTIDTNFFLYENTTNTAAEIYAVIEALEVSKMYNPTNVNIITDCQTIVGLLDRRKSGKLDTTKRQEYLEIFSLLDSLSYPVQFIKTKGHGGGDPIFRKLDIDVRRQLRLLS